MGKFIRIYGEDKNQTIALRADKIIAVAVSEEEQMTVIKCGDDRICSVESADSVLEKIEASLAEDGRCCSQVINESRVIDG